MLSANQIVGSLNFNISKSIVIRYKVNFLYAGTYLLELQIDDKILVWRGQAYLGMPKQAIKTWWGAFSCDLFFKTLGF